MKVLFLDLDGVLNNTDTTERYNRYVGLDPELIARLNRVVDSTGAKVVITSDWRLYETFHDIVAYLKKQGFTGEVVGCTRDLFGVSREKEVEDWLERNQDVEKYAIIDDFHQFPFHPFVYTNPDKGLTDSDAEKLIELLNN